MTSSTLNRVREIAEPIIESEGMELVDITFKKEGKSWILRIFIDKEDGVLVDDCTNISQQVGKLLEIEEIVIQEYMLEVSSPGLDRELKEEKDFHRFLGRLVRVNTYTPLNGRKKFVGKLTGFERQTVILEDENGEVVEIPYSLVSKANLEIEF